MERERARNKRARRGEREGGGKGGWFHLCV